MLIFFKKQNIMVTTAKEEFKNEFKIGTETEQRFLKDCESLGIVCTKSTPQEDMEDHFDFIITAKGKEFKVDVKGLKKLTRKDAEAQEDYHFLEIVSVAKKRGWAFGKADLFVFETFGYWIFVKKDALQKLILEKVKKEKVSKVTECLYKLYTREGRQDLITMVKSLDLMAIASKRMKKSVIPAI